MKRRYIINSLALAGFLSGLAPVAASNFPEFKDVTEPNERLFDVLRYDQKYNIAAHRSHSSHASHGSHRSSSGGSVSKRKSSVKSTPVYTPPKITKPQTTKPTTSKPKTSRNQQTTPSTSILPSTPAITKPKTLPGHSEKFKKVVMEVQFALYAFDYYKGAIDGVLGPETKSALAKFQADSNMKVTGTINAEVMKVFGIRVE